jgi:D-glycero-D-manno-heptose 1,7-bisphosphate phosphatase
MNPAVFLDRDGVLIQDIHLLTHPEQIVILPGVAAALRDLAAAGFYLFVTSNQPVVARGMATEADVESVHAELQRRLTADGGPMLKRFYFCPHHPNATLPQYRVACECRKPRPGMLLQAAREYEVDLRASFAVGDRITDIIAGARAGCRTILVQTGMHAQPPIETAEPLDVSVQPDFICADLVEAADWILSNSEQGQKKHET